jgi:uroporphyrinogen decarboxylase
MKHFAVDDLFGLAQAMEIDLIMNVDAPMIKRNRKGIWDVEFKTVPLPDGSGVYAEPVSFPIESCETIDEIEACYEWPTTGMFDYSNIKKDARNIRDNGYAVMGGYNSLSLFYSNIRGIEQMLADFAGNPELSEYVLFKLNEFASSHVRKILEAGDGLIDITQVTDDFGCQRGLLLSEIMIQRYFGKYYESNVALGKEFGAHIFHHDDGAVTELIPWIIEKGCQTLNPLQWHLPGWDLPELKEKYGSKLCFHGGIDNQLVLPFQGVEEVKAEVRACIDSLYTNNTGYILAPCHNVQAITPLENVLTMYEYAREYGVAK